MKLQKLLKAQREFSKTTFGEDVAPQRITAHLRQELEEIEQDPQDLTEWADFLLITLDGWWRTGQAIELNYFNPSELTHNEDLLHTYDHKLELLGEHLERLEQANRQPEMYELMAAQIFIVASSYHHHAEDLIREAYLKIELNKRRQWHQPADPTQPIRHITL